MIQMTNSVTKEEIKKAKQIDIIDFLESRGFELKPVGTNEFKLIEHDSLQVNGDGYFYWNSKNVWGDSIKLIQELFGVSFQEAVRELLADDSPKMVHTANSEDKEEIEQVSIQEADNQRRVIAYLVKKRMIDYDIVIGLIKQGKLIQDTKGNCCFIRENNSAELHGTADQRFKGQYGRQMNYGFELQIDDDIEYVIYTESAIDLISLYQLYKEKLSDTLLVSMSGLKSNVIRHYVKLFPNAKHIIAVDNDEPADDFYIELKEEFPEIKRRKPNGVKDWNEELLDRCGA